MMSVTISLGWWLAPTIVTLAAFMAGFIACRGDGRSSIADGVIALIIYATATIVSLVAWLVWSILQ